MKKQLIIGTRASKLALAQTESVRDALREFYPNLDIQLKTIQTKGDKILDTALSKIGDKGLFTKEIENQLLAGKIDLAVHSLKDLPTQLPEGLTIAALPPRRDCSDAFVSFQYQSIQSLPPAALIFTGSLRRRAQMLALRNDLDIQDIRGNIHTRLQKLKDSQADGMIMAAAGLVRSQLEKHITEQLNPTAFLPAPGQGALAIEIRQNDTQTAQMLEPLNHLPTQITTTAERVFLATLEGGCQIPIAAHAVINGQTLTLHGLIANLDGTQIIRDHITGPIDNPAQLGQTLAQTLLNKGAREILDSIIVKNKTLLYPEP